MNTNEIILALVEKYGFRLPDDVRVGWFFTDSVDICHLTDQQAHDLIACEFARQAGKPEGDTASVLRGLYITIEQK